MFGKLQDAAWLKEQYVDKCRTLSSIAEEVGCNKTTAERALKKFGIERRKRTSKHFLMHNKEWLYQQYVVEKRSMKDIAEEAGTTAGNIHDALETMGVQRRGIKEAYDLKYPDGRLAEMSGNWKGGRRIINGYVFLYVPDHPYAVNGIVQEHRLVMEKHLGRYLEPYEVVHHLDGNRQNNAIENLEVKTRGRHISEHFKASHEVLQLRIENAELKTEVERLKQGT